MKLQTALIINSIASLLLIIVWVPLSNVARENFNQALNAQADSKAILQDFVELNESTSLLSSESKQSVLKQWRRRYDLASLKLLPQYFEGTTELLILKKVERDFSALLVEFKAYETFLTNGGEDLEIAIEPYTNALAATSHRILEQMLLLTDLKQTQLAEASRAVDVYRTTTIIGAFSAITLINFLIYRSISIPIKKLADISERISKGELNVQISEDDLPQFGEFKQLSHAFVTMTKELNSLYSSLEQKVEAKTKALSESLEDVEEEKEKYEEQVLETEKFKQAVDSATDGIMIIKVDGDIAYINSSWSKITGYSNLELVNKNIRDLQQEKPEEKIYARVWQGMLNVNNTVSEEVVNKHKDGTYYQSQIGVYPIEEEGRPIYYVCMQQDITKRKEVDKAKTEFVSLASHQLRTPLSTIGWYTEMLMSGDAGKLTEEQIKLLEEIYQGNKRMVDLVNALLNVSRIELGTFSIDTEWINIIELAETVIDDLKIQINEKSHHLETDYDMKLPDIKADPNLIRIVIQNLLSNAIKYTPEGGHITLSIKADTPDNIGSGSDFSSVIIQIKDDGIGIPGRQQEQLFTKLFRADNVKETDTEGTGLGLYLAKAIVDYSGGTIDFESKENEGTTFTISIPKEGMEDKEGSKNLISEVIQTSTSHLKPI